MSYRVRSHKFCCCIPVRLGVCIIGLLGVASGGLLAIAGIIRLKQLGDVDMHLKLPYIIQTLVYALYAGLSMLGLLGAICKRIGLIKAFVFTLTIHVLLSLASGGYSIYQYFKDAPDTVQSCINGHTDDVTIETCKKGVSVMKGVMVALFVFVWLMEIWGVFIVRSYKDQLDEEGAMEEKLRPPRW
ncbi:hypothetical protein K435DRAFT_834098 [Dendrothele bispora CBS 962.96]|uniref:Tetraspannin-domain-containing protein n=1 Tax=Dendrothele bispora (strain CBS 962.96) TaxID=1314807 RepID=A0A4S8MUB0_DENBC|nr:hypothetical protein K435DRAFT_834098 [Dendrothele bispora CBS 962.96]